MLGGLSAGTWATLMHFGQRGYRDAIGKILSAAQRIAQGVDSFPFSPLYDAVPRTFELRVVARCFQFNLSCNLFAFRVLSLGS